MESKEPCQHGVKFDAESVKGLSSDEIRVMFPRLNGECPLGCGYIGIAYESFLHYISGDW